eukprot:6207921-Pleurochrysis_carterae.AAC.2
MQQNDATEIDLHHEYRSMVHVPTDSNKSEQQYRFCTDASLKPTYLLGKGLFMPIRTLTMGC